MTFAFIDPALLVYRAEDWRVGSNLCHERCCALLFHRGFVRNFGLRFLWSNDLMALLWNSFPFDVDLSRFPEFRDFKAFVYDDLQRAKLVDCNKDGTASIVPDGVVCLLVSDQCVVDTWCATLQGCPENTRVASWRPAGSGGSRDCATIEVRQRGSTGTSRKKVYFLVYNDPTSWAQTLDACEWWPDFEKAVQLQFWSSPGLRGHRAARQSPLALTCDPQFVKSAGRYCRSSGLRKSLLQALAKRVYGITDSALRDESYCGVRRFRVTSFWRVHYEETAHGLRLLKLGPHDMDD